MREYTVGDIVTYIRDEEEDYAIPPQYMVTEIYSDILSKYSRVTNLETGAMYRDYYYCFSIV